MRGDGRGVGGVLARGTAGQASLLFNSGEGRQNSNKLQINIRGVCSQGELGGEVNFQDERGRPSFMQIPEQTNMPIFNYSKVHKL